MKTLIIISAFCVVFSLKTQAQTDCMGFPSPDGSNYNNNISLKIEVDVTPTVPVASFPSPCQFPSGITFYNNDLWVCGYNTYEIYRVSSVDGSVLRTISIPIQRPYGISIYNDIIYVLDNQNKFIYKLRINDGSVLDSINLNNLNLRYPAGLMIWQNEFWFNDNGGSQPSAPNDSLLAIDENGNKNHSQSAIGSFQTGMVFDGQYFWITDNPSQTTFQIDPYSQEIIQAIEAPGGIYPNGLGWDGSALWYINNESDSIYKVYPPTIITTANENNISGTLEVFPNPTQNSINIFLPEKNLKTIITDACGKIVEELNANTEKTTFDFSTSGLPKGLYIIKSFSNEKNYTSKIIFQ